MNDFDTIETLVNGNMRLAHWFVARNPKVDRAEALSVAMEGLLMAARAFDPDRSDFGKFAYIVIERRFRDHWARVYRKKRIHSAVSLEATFDDGDEIGGNVLPDERAVRPDDHASAACARARLDTALRRLPKMKLTVVAARFGLGGGEDQTLEAIGQQFGMSRERARQIVAEALGDLRLNIEAQGTGRQMSDFGDWRPTVNARQRMGGRKKISVHTDGEQ